MGALRENIESDAATRLNTVCCEYHAKISKFGVSLSKEVSMVCIYIDIAMNE